MKRIIKKLLEPIVREIIMEEKKKREENNKEQITKATLLCSELVARLFGIQQSRKENSINL